MSIFVDTFVTPFFPEPESLYNNSIVVMIDVLRSSSTIITALRNGAKEIIPADTLERAVKIYANLSKDVCFLGGERNGQKPLGFDAGNSPFEYTRENIEGKSVIFTTTNGTRIFQKAKQAKYRVIGGFNNLGILTNYVIEKANNPQEEIKKIIFLCAGNDGNLSSEDMLCAGNYIYLLSLHLENLEFSDSAIISKQLYELNENNYGDFLRARTHSQKLLKLEYNRDIEYCFTKDNCKVIPLIGNTSIKKAEL